MQRIIFTLSMPGCKSWNGKWSGQDSKHTVSRFVSEKKLETLKEYYTHSFGDGWVAGVSVRKAKPRERVTNKFCGYEWMISNILTKGVI